MKRKLLFRCVTIGDIRQEHTLRVQRTLSMSPLPHRVLGANLAYERKRRALSMSALAELAGTHASEISRIEHAQRDPRLSTIVRVARGLEIPVVDLLRGIR
jgi:ribosome-binding protein aMBF1 (putative translation factor)